MHSVLNPQHSLLLFYANTHWWQAHTHTHMMHNTNRHLYMSVEMLSSSPIPFACMCALVVRLDTPVHTQKHRYQSGCDNSFVHLHTNTRRDMNVLVRGTCVQNKCLTQCCYLDCSAARADGSNPGLYRRSGLPWHTAPPCHVYNWLKLSCQTLPICQLCCRLAWSCAKSWQKHGRAQG